MSVLEPKFVPNRDTTYCTNDNCKQKLDCFRWRGNYDFPNDYYWFCNFSEEECNKGYAKKGT